MHVCVVLIPASFKQGFYDFLLVSIVFEGKREDVVEFCTDQGIVIVLRTFQELLGIFDYSDSHKV